MKRGWCGYEEGVVMKRCGVVMKRDGVVMTRCGVVGNGGQVGGLMVGCAASLMRATDIGHARAITSSGAKRPWRTMGTSTHPPQPPYNDHTTPSCHHTTIIPSHRTITPPPEPWAPTPHTITHHSHTTYTILENC